MLLWRLISRTSAIVFLLLSTCCFRCYRYESIQVALRLTRATTAGFSTSDCYRVIKGD